MTGRSRLRWAVVGGIALVVLGAALLRRAGFSEFPPPRPLAPSPQPQAPVFVGSAACAQCHGAQYQAWSRSTHGRAGAAPPTRTHVIAPFDGRPLTFRDAVVTPNASGGRFMFTVAQANRPVRTFQVDAVVGGGHMEGGGTQAYFTRFPDGTFRFLPFDYSRHERRFFCNTLGRANRGWLPISRGLALADCGDWPPKRVLGSSPRFQSCQQCHGSQIEVVLDSASRRTETRFTTLAINCESCHGPGREHVELARSGAIGSRPDIGLRSLATLTKDQSLAVCFQCHAAKTPVAAGDFALKLPLLLDTIYHPDGRTRSFGYQEGHLASDCYLNGSMTCVDCHDPHSQRYRDVSGTPLPGRFDDGQCLGCHPSKAEPSARHTHHAEKSAGSRCVSCHMPYLQQPNVGPEIRYARSDHAIPIPRPAFDTRLGVESACRQCHADRTVEALQRQVAEWWGDVKPHPDAVTAALAARGTRDAATAARMLTGGEGHAWAEFVGLTEVIVRIARPDSVVLDRATLDHLKRLAADSDPDLQALALATLHLARGADGGVRRFLTRQVRALGPRAPAVRSRWVWILRVRADAFLSRNDHAAALTTFRKAWELAPDDAAVLRGLGMVYTRLQDYAKAVEHFRASLTADSTDPQALIGLGFALMQQGDLDGAMAAHREAIRVGPWDPGGYANLALVQLRRGAVVPAIDTLRRALALDPGLAEAYFLLARAYAALGRNDEARVELEHGLEFDPRNVPARRVLETLSRP